MEDLIKSIDSATTFEEIAEIKESAYRYNKAAGNNYEDILSGLYKDPTHFIYELLQNAEDTGATCVSFDLHSDRLIVQHDGRPFNLRDIRGITGINDNTKKNDITKIGTFGIGFKSVFSVCECPEIFSDQFDFRIHHFSVPQKIARSEKYKNGKTYIVLPFKPAEKEKIYQLVENKLTSLPADTLIFLNSIKQIDYLTESFTGYYQKKETIHKTENGSYTECAIKGDDIDAHYLIFSRNLSIDQRLTASIAYGYDHKDKRIISLGDSTKLVVFFNTEQETFLQFKIHGPFQTTPTREAVPETEANKSILDDLVSLYAQSILCLKELGFVTVEFLSMLPLTARNGYSTNIFYEKFYSQTFKILSEEEILPTSKGKFTTASDALLARGPLTKLLLSEDIKKIWGRTQWVSTRITRDRTFELAAYLNRTLKIPEVSIADFMEKVPADFFEGKSNDWLIDLYSKLSTITLTKKMLIKPFIRVESGKTEAPFKENGSHNIYFPSKLMPDKDKVICGELLKNKEAVQFFKGIDIIEKDFTELVRTDYIPLLQNCTTAEEHFENFYLLYLECKEQSQSIQKEVQKLLSESECIIYLGQDKVSFEVPSEFLFAHGVSGRVYSGIDDGWFLYDKLDKTAQSDSQFKTFLKNIGVCAGVYLREDKYQLTYNERLSIMLNAPYSTCKEFAYNIWNLSDIIKNMSLDRSHALWSALNALNESAFSGQLMWWYYNRRGEARFDAYFVKTLQTSKWLYNAENELVSPEGMYESEIKKLYGDGIALKYFKFKSDVFSQLPEEDRRRLEATKGIPVDELEKLMSEYRSKMAVKIEEEVAATSAEIEKIVFSNPYEGKTTEELTGITDVTEMDDDVAVTADKSSQPPAPTVSIETHAATAQAEGDLGEKIVMESLKKQYEQNGYKIYNDKLPQSFTAMSEGHTYFIKRHNNDAFKQHGFDITVSERGKILKYIEVKTKTGNEKKAFRVSGLQWRTARKLFEDGAGDTHFIYLVNNVYDADNISISEIPNPYKAWLEGKLDAHPVAIRL